MTNHINLMGFDQSTSFTGVFAGQYDLDNPLKAPKVILWETIGKKRKKPDPFESCREIHGVICDAHRKLLSEPVYEYGAYTCEDGYIDWTKPKVGLSIKMAQGWVDGVTAATCNKPVHHFMPTAWRTIWGKHGCSGTEQYKAHSIRLAKANMSGVESSTRLIKLTDHMADAFWITCHLFKKIVDKEITI